MTKRLRGFTVIELAIIVAFIGVIGTIYYFQKNNAEVVARDNIKKTAINSFYYGLEEVFYPVNGYYPRFIDSPTLKSIDENIFIDPNGVKLGTVGSEYIYTPLNCLANKCKGYTLKATLENEADYVKTSRNN